MASKERIGSKDASPPFAERVWAYNNHSASGGALGRRSHMRFTQRRSDLDAASPARWSVTSSTFASSPGSEKLQETRCESAGSFALQRMSGEMEMSGNDHSPGRVTSKDRSSSPASKDMRAASKERTSSKDARATFGEQVWAYHQCGATNGATGRRSHMHFAPRRNEQNAALSARMSAGSSTRSPRCNEQNLTLQRASSEMKTSDTNHSPGRAASKDRCGGTNSRAASKERTGSKGSPTFAEQVWSYHQYGTRDGQNKPATPAGRRSHMRFSSRKSEPDFAFSGQSPIISNICSPSRRKEKLHALRSESSGDFTSPETINASVEIPDLASAYSPRHAGPKLSSRNGDSHQIFGEKAWAYHNHTSDWDSAMRGSSKVFGFESRHDDLGLSQDKTGGIVDFIT
eukprot:gnl/TRDRNA2_/TRDRNA2_143972_c1_seq1.p1 gnl/TRDRNA2_/TRDRNA2_143972_c1~~gnl/TRDRNA2_/TRDRNA2_143972_c1_seq1.p1  ORF type:complete len:459 (+),score=37.02 gnl/TRDRNA2_/TRDRNA2_143972_c1_seq1:176-1378(+)